MKPLTRAESRDVDRRAVQELGIPSIVLMENAGRGAAEALLKHEPPIRTVLILCGKGNNGGDGFVIARHMAIAGVRVRLALLAVADELAGDARLNYEIVQRLELPVTLLGETDELTTDLDRLAIGVDWIVDAMLGTGAQGEPRQPYRTAIEWLNQQAARKLAVDVPSGLDCDTGEPALTTVRADATCTFHAPKVGFLNRVAQAYLGDLQVVSIGIPAA